MPSLNALRKANPDMRVVRTVQNLGLRLGIDRIPSSLRRKFDVGTIKLKPLRKGTQREPYWHALTVPTPEVQLVPKRHDETLLGKFMVEEWKRLQHSIKEGEHEHNGLPKESIRNPFIPWLDPVTKHWNPPLYNLHWQRALVKEARRLNMTHLLPSGPKTPLEFANTHARVWTERGRERERVELGTIRWSGVYEKKLNPFGVGRYFRTPDEVEEEKERRKAEKEQLKAEGAAEREWADFEKEVQVFPEEREVGGLPRWGPYAGRYLLFKGKKRERDAPTRRAEIAARMASMAKRVETWKRELKVAEEKARPSLPY